MAETAVVVVVVAVPVVAVLVAPRVRRRRTRPCGPLIRAVPPRGVASAAILHQPSDFSLRGFNVAALHLDQTQLLAHGKMRAGAFLNLPDLLAAFADNAALLPGALD